MCENRRLGNSSSELNSTKVGFDTSDERERERRFVRLLMLGVIQI